MSRNPWETLAGRSERMAELLEKNHSVSAFMNALLDHLIDYCNHKGIAFEDIELTDTFIGHDEYIRARIRIK